MNNITIVIPIYKLTSYRLENFKFLLENLKHINVPYIIAEQISKIDGEAHLQNCYGKNHIKFVTDSDIFHKAWLLNKCIDRVETEYVWFVDCDYYMDFESIITKAQYIGKDFYQPYYKAKELNVSQTYEIKTTKNIKEELFLNNGSDDKRYRIYGALSFIANVKALNDIGGLDETYKGWGYEDLDLFMRVHQHDKYKLTIEPEKKGVHLWHPRPSNSNRSNNQKHFKSKGYSIDSVKKILDTTYYNKI